MSKRIGTANFSFTLSSVSIKDATGFPTVKVPVNLSQSTRFSNGNTAAGEANEWIVRRYATIGVSNTQLDVTSFTDLFNVAAAALTKAKAFFIANTSASNSITLAAPASNGWATLFGVAIGTAVSLTLAPGDFLFRSCAESAGIACGATNRLLNITSASSGNTDSVNVGVLGIA